jgi:hypothetical protein
MKALTHMQVRVAAFAVLTVTAQRQCRYKPKSVDGDPVQTTMRVEASVRKLAP